jgi:hypothetical protein
MNHNKNFYDCDIQKYCILLMLMYFKQCTYNELNTASTMVPANSTVWTKCTMNKQQLCAKE